MLSGPERWPLSSAQQLLRSPPRTCFPGEWHLECLTLAAPKHSALSGPIQGWPLEMGPVLRAKNRSLLKEK